MAIPTVINSVLIVVILFTAIVAVGAGYAGCKKYKDEVFWRKVKLYSSILALIGIGVALINFDIAARAIWKDDRKEHLILEFIVARTDIAMSMATICSEISDLPEEKNTCGDLKNISMQIPSSNLIVLKPMRHITNWQNNPRIEEAVTRANRQIDSINRLIEIPVDEQQIVSKESRAYILLIAATLLALAVAGSIGEAAFQLRVAKDRKG